jgi:hypothetical protein
MVIMQVLIGICLLVVGYLIGSYKVRLDNKRWVEAGLSRAQMLIKKDLSNNLIIRAPNGTGIMESISKLLRGVNFGEYNFEFNVNDTSESSFDKDIHSNAARITDMINSNMFRTIVILRSDSLFNFKVLIDKLLSEGATNEVNLIFLTQERMSDDNGIKILDQNKTSFLRFDLTEIALHYDYR